MKLGFIGAGFIARFVAVAIHRVRGLEVAGIMASYLFAERGRTIDLPDKAMLAELDYVPLIQQGKGAAQFARMDGRP